MQRVVCGRSPRQITVISSRGMHDATITELSRVHIGKIPGGLHRLRCALASHSSTWTCWAERVRHVMLASGCEITST